MDEELSQAKRSFDFDDSRRIFVNDDDDKTVAFIDNKCLAAREKQLLKLIHRLSDQEKITLEPEEEAIMEEID